MPKGSSDRREKKGGEWLLMRRLSSVGVQATVSKANERGVSARKAWERRVSCGSLSGRGRNCVVRVNRVDGGKWKRRGEGGGRTAAGTLVAGAQEESRLSGVGYTACTTAAEGCEAVTVTEMTSEHSRAVEAKAG